MSLVINLLNPSIMQKSVKALVLITISFVLAVSAIAQLKLPVVNGVVADLKKVVADYPEHFTHLIGDMEAEHPQSTDYLCNFNFNGAEYSLFTIYSANQKNISSFEAQMLTTESFDKAKQKFHALCNQLNNLVMTAGASGSFRLKGVYEAPVEEKKFASVIYSPEPAGPAVSKLKVEVSLQADNMEWKVKLLVYDREREDDQKGETKE